MFNGIIFNTGIIKSIIKNKKSIFIGVKSKIKLGKKDLGCSISCNGVCLTLVKVNYNLIYFYISNESLKRSNFKFLKINQLINLETSINFGQKISGHYIQGHVDTTANVKNIKLIDKTWLIKFNITNSKLKNLLVEKASISINGISLTISRVLNNSFEINVIPHTLKLTNLSKLKKNDKVNVELDIFGKYIYKYSN
jgi:riboflavin synthase